MQPLMVYALIVFHLSQLTESESHQLKLTKAHAVLV